MVNMTVSTISSMPFMSWGYHFNAGYLFMPSELNIEHTDIILECSKG
ncbi:MAG TPA: hypothetical protein VHQ24_14340 [Lachnospiraceae bacterium]|nr:hypothetical protein [Lachnospiraceae bacterium]